MNKKRIFFLTLAVITVITVIIIIIRNQKSSINSTFIFPLKYGSKGIQVEALQEWLNLKSQAGIPDIAVDGIFGTETETRLKLITGSDSMTEQEFNSKI